MSDNQIGEEGARLINELLKSNSTLITVHLDGDKGKAANNERNIGNNTKSMNR